MDRPDLLQMRYYDTYWYAQVVHGVICGHLDHERIHEEFFGDLGFRRFLVPYPRWSALHDFIDFAFWQIAGEAIDDVELDAVVCLNRPFWAETVLREHGLEHLPLRAWASAKKIGMGELSESDLCDYTAFLAEEGPLECLAEQIVEEVFFLLFLNRDFLKSYHLRIAGIITSLDSSLLSPSETQAFGANGRLRRKRIPKWARRAVYYRDRGRCGLCHRDISGLVSLSSSDHFDHIVPLAAGGINDVTNLQLLCEGCNLHKGGGDASVSNYYERWYASGG